MNDAPLRCTPGFALQLASRVYRLEELHEARSERSLRDALDDIRARLTKLEAERAGDGRLPYPRLSVVPDSIRFDSRGCRFSLVSELSSVVS